MAGNLLTIGMASFADFDGAYFGLSSIRAHHPPGVDLLVIDTEPGGCTRTRDITRAVGGEYHHRPDLAGTAAPRDALFRLAKTPWVMVVDSHVLLETGAVQAALDYAAANPESNDLVQGPLIYDNGQPSTHWRPTTPPGLWGTWDADPRVSGEDVFDIPGQGLGQFMMRRAAWPGFHPLHRGFGGEEGYLHEKVRKRGGRALCHPRLRWRHRFRHMEFGAPPPPYPLRLEDHVWNLLVTHREVGIDAEAAILKDFGKNLPREVWDRLVREAAAFQPLGVGLEPPAPQRILGVWYSNNAAPVPVAQASLRTVEAARASATRHAVKVLTSSWSPLPGNPLPWQPAPDQKAGHANVVRQVRAMLERADREGFAFDAVAFLEHDVLYPADYFDRVGDALARRPDAPVVSNLDYEGLNHTGWQPVRERHEPLHQLTLRRAVAMENLERAAADCDRQGWAYLEPDHDADRSKWARLPFGGGPVPMPAVHVNYPAHGGGARFTSHGDVCYQPVADRDKHPYWGDFRRWWPADLSPVPVAARAGGPVPLPQAQPKAGGCGCGAKGKEYATAEDWYADALKAQDCFEHLPTVRELAAKCDSALELNVWASPWLAAVVAGGVKRVASVSPAPMGNWQPAAALLGAGFEGVLHDGPGPDLGEFDLLVTDTRHTAARLVAELDQHAAKVRKYVVIHDTEIYGEAGDDGGPGLLVGLRGWLKAHPEWTVVRSDKNNYGLVVLSRLAEDKKTPPALWRKALNFSKALAEHAKDGMTLVDDETHAARLELCVLCPSRHYDTCGECGCPVDKKSSWASSECPLGKWGKV